MSLPPTSAPDDTEIAAEFVLRVLPDDAYRVAAVRAATDPAFAAEVRAWEERFAAMTDEIVPVPPRPATKAVLLERLFGPATAANRVGNNTTVWKALTAIGFAAAAALAVIAFVPQPTDDQTPGNTRFVAELAVAGDTTRMFAVYAADTGNLNIAWTARETTDGRVLQLWGVIDGQEPVSVGVLPPGRTATLAFPEVLAVNTDGLVLVLSDEPEGGSPTGQPTGDILASAPVSTL